MRLPFESAPLCPVAVPEIFCSLFASQNFDRCHSLLLASSATVTRTPKLTLFVLRTPMQRSQTAPLRYLSVHISHKQRYYYTINIFFCNRVTKLFSQPLLNCHLSLTNVHSLFLNLYKAYCKFFELVVQCLYICVDSHTKS